MRACFRCLLFTVAAFVSSSGNALAWGDKAHEVICEIAFRLAQPATQAEIQRLIFSDPGAAYPDFSESCVYPDHPFPSKFRIRKFEHFINLPRDSNGLQSDECPTIDPCVLTAIYDDTKMLSSRTEPDAKRLVSLESLGHWVGDIHQPLHVSFQDDRGGNTPRNITGCRSNLHAVWDTCLVEDVVGRDVSRAAVILMKTVTPEMRQQWVNSTAKDWANESFAIAKSPATEYCTMRGQTCTPRLKQLTITDEYLKTNKPIVREQLQKAGVRLAHILDAALN
jgi:hypothetical protein